MALIFTDGFDHYATADITKKWSTNPSSFMTIDPVGGRRGGGAMKRAGNAASTEYASLSFANNTNGIVVGVAYSATNNGGAAQSQVFSINDGTTAHVSVYVYADRSISVGRGGNGSSHTVLAQSSANIIPASGYCYIELKVTSISDTSGAVTLRVNGATVASASNVDTKNTTNTYWNTIRIAGGGTTPFFTNPFFDDLYICDTTGTTNNDFLGDVRVDTIFPDGNGTYSQFLGSDGNSTDNYLLVDETAPNTTDYTESSTVGDRDSYAMQNLAALASQVIYGIQVNAAILKDDAGARSAGTMIRSGTTNGDGAGVALGTSQVYISQIYETNPDTSAAWTETTVNAMEAGVKVTA